MGPAVINWEVAVGGFIAIAAILGILGFARSARRDNSWAGRKAIFTVGSRYRVKTDDTTGPSKFRRGEELIFKIVGYVPYDGGHYYAFESLSEGKKTWFLHDRTSAKVWKQWFEEM